jgi:hypothetical protein
MTHDAIECFNCGHANPAWAQICRNCGAPIQAQPRSHGGPGGIFPTDQASLISIGITVAAIVGAIVVGLLLSGMLPAAPPAPTATPTPSASVSEEPSVSAAPSVSSEATPLPSIVLPGTITFGYGLNESTSEVIDVATTFARGQFFAHSIKLSEPFGVDQIQEEVVRVNGDGTLTVVQERTDEVVPVTADSDIVGFRVSAGSLIDLWGEGNYILRAYRGVELLAEGSFTLGG